MSSRARWRTFVLSLAIAGGGSWSGAAQAQNQPCPFGVPWCQVGPDGRLILQPPTAGAGAGGTAQGQGQAQGGGVLSPPPIDYAGMARARLQWQEYFRVEAELRAKARAEVHVRLQTRFELELQRSTPNPFAGYAPPVSFRTEERPGWGHVTLGLLPACLGVWTGHGRPAHVKFCPNVLVRLDRDWSLELGLSMGADFYGDFGFYSNYGFHPGVQYGLWEAGRSTGSLFLSGGLDLWAPTSGGRRTPDAYLGGHAGVGAEYKESGWNMALELRGLVRGGLAGDDPLAQAMSTPRLGLELRLTLVRFTPSHARHPRIR